jgi:hypothetical protein
MIRNIFNKIDKILAIVGLVICISLEILLFKKMNSIVYILPFIFTSMSCLFWLFTQDGSYQHISIRWDRHIYIVLCLAFFLLLTLSICVLHFRENIYVRPILFFIITAVMSGLISVEIMVASLSDKISKSIILLQILILGLCLVFSQMLLYPSVIGNDPWYHQMFATIIVDKSSIPDGFGYSKLPIYHLYVASLMLLTNLDYKNSSMLSVSLLHVVIGGMFIYLLGRNITNDKTALLSGLVLVTANLFIKFSYWVVPNSVGAIFILIIIYLLFASYEKSMRYHLLALFFMFVLILTHTVSSMCLEIILLGSWILFIIYYNFREDCFKSLIPLRLAILFFTSMFAWWIYASGHISEIATLIKWGFSIDSDVQISQQSIKYALNSSIAESLFNSIGLNLFFSMSNIGFFYMISKKYASSKSFALAFIGMTILSVSYFSFVFGLSIIEGRWWYFAQILLAIPFSISLLYIINLTNYGAIRLIALFAFVATISFFMIMSTNANTDNRSFSETIGFRSALIESELRACDAARSIFNRTMSMDTYYTEVGYLGQNVSDISKNLYTKRFERSDNLILIRSEIIDHPFDSSVGNIRLEYNPRCLLENYGFSRVYDCGSVTGHIYF